MTKLARIPISAGRMITVALGDRTNHNNPPLMSIEEWTNFLDTLESMRRALTVPETPQEKPIGVEQSTGKPVTIADNGRVTFGHPTRGTSTYANITPPGPKLPPGPHNVPRAGTKRDPHVYPDAYASQRPNNHTSEWSAEGGHYMTRCDNPNPHPRHFWRFESMTPHNARECVGEA